MLSHALVLVISEETGKLPFH
ncbi:MULTISPECIES: hypothetical protein [Bacillus]|nr:MULTISPECIES: hypothetical protein [Bacillus]MDA2312539.1 hypothetical protein [Bacillus cereus]MDA2317769.1 hypothetical protein [Bacillus cereus]MDA2501443.1 hypothetical protein [Bacillus cereus]MDF9489726.1 hypothetical protein [Bacillus cereus]MDH8003289.1 hypothetical protein [Bacillus cereus]